MPVGVLSCLVLSLGYINTGVVDKYAMGKVCQSGMHTTLQADLCACQLILLRGSVQLFELAPRARVEFHSSLSLCLLTLHSLQGTQGT